MDEGIQLDPMRLIESLQRRVAALTMENVQLETAVNQLQLLLTSQEEATYPLQEVGDVTDEVVGAEIGKAEITA